MGNDDWGRTDYILITIFGLAMVLLISTITLAWWFFT